VQQRQPLEQLRQQSGVDEVLLSDSSGALLEGLVSNFFVIAKEAELGLTLDQNAAAVAAAAAANDTAGTSAPSSSRSSSTPAADAAGVGPRSSSRSTAGLVLLTAGPQHAALPGVSQARVLQACQQLQLKVLQQPARPDQRHAWQEAFLTNW
jgi:branched-subunit amino acid aminotransferase/4-amino-4-deoxychorismate lyase